MQTLLLVRHRGKVVNEALWQQAAGLCVQAACAQWNEQMY